MNTVAAPAAPLPATLLRLGRVSNLPTVWTNVLAGACLADPAVAPGALAIPLVAVSLFYVGGMFLNDYFDREIDRRERPGRPIPSGAIPERNVALIGSGLLAAGLALLLFASLSAFVLGLLLCGAIVAYDLHHKGNAYGPVVMAACRFLVYPVAAASVSSDLSAPIWLWGAILACHVVGLTYAAKQESLARVTSFWPLAILAVPVLAGLRLVPQDPAIAVPLLALITIDGLAVMLLARRATGTAVPIAVSLLIAAISLVDAIAIAAKGGSLALVAICLSGFVLTQASQRLIPGT